MNRGKNRARDTAAVLATVIVVLTALHACGDPQPPQIKDIQITYWDGQAWQGLEPLAGGGSAAHGSPVAIQGFITDNTAVVEPAITLEASRQDVAPWPGTCERVTIAGLGDYCVFQPIAEDDLIRGDLLVLTLTVDEETMTGGQTTNTSTTLQVEVHVKEALGLDKNAPSQQIQQDYRIFKVASLSGDPNPYLWALSYAFCNQALPPPNDCAAPPTADDLERLLSGDSLALLDGTGAYLNRRFRLLVPFGDQVVPTGLGSSTTYRLLDAKFQSATWESLVKWNQGMALTLDSKTGGFGLQYVFFDPRVDSRGSTYAVTMRTIEGQPGPQFDPQIQYIQVGDTVTWTNADAAIHTSTSGEACTPDGRWDSGDVAPGESFSFTFDQVGTFPYFSVPDCSLGMTGEIRVSLPPVYNFVLSAHDVPNEGDGSIRFAFWGIDPAFPIFFTPPDILPAPSPTVPEDPAIVVNELVKDSSSETSTAINSLTGLVGSVAGEVKGFQFVLSNASLTPPFEYQQRVYSFDPEILSFGGAFSSSVQMVPDWKDRETGRIRNHLQILAYGMRDRAAKGPAPLARTEFVYDFDFLPPAPGQSAPSLQIVDTFPALNANGLAYLPLRSGGAAGVGEPLRVRALAADNGGQPQVAYWWSVCDSEVDFSNPTQALCRDCQGGGTGLNDLEGPNDLDAVGQFPGNPWRFMQIVPQNACAEANANGTCPSAVIAVTRASQRPTDGGLPLFSAAAMTLQQSFEDGPFTVNAPVAVSQGPILSTTGPGNGTLIATGSSLDLKAILTASSVPLNRTIALFNGHLAGSPAYAADNITLEWTLDGAAQVGNRICLGGESVSGHRTVELYEFVAVDGNQVQVGASTISDLRECSVVQGEAPAVFLQKYFRHLVVQQEPLPAPAKHFFYRSLETTVLGRDAAVEPADLGFEYHCQGPGDCPQTFEFCTATGNFFWEPSPEAEVVNGDWACVSAVSGTHVSVYRLDYTRGANPDVPPTVTVRHGTSTQELGCKVQVPGNAAGSATGMP